MYLRHSVRLKNGRRHTYWRLVRSVRRGGKVVQETVAQLGELDAEGRANAWMLAQQITDTDQQRELFEAAATGEQRIAVRLDRVCIERARWFGGVLAPRMAPMTSSLVRRVVRRGACASRTTTSRRGACQP